MEPMSRHRDTFADSGSAARPNASTTGTWRSTCTTRDEACRDLAAGLATAEPAIASDIVLGARAVMLVEERFARHLLCAWAAARP